jgi:putative component of membrane protein insertase Oxa1/YidC/SpoIIIJ protein YidD
MDGKSFTGRMDGRVTQCHPWMDEGMDGWTVLWQIAYTSKSLFFF